MRHALAAGAFALSIAVSSVGALADQQPNSIIYTQSATNHGVDAQAVSPDVAAWTSRLIISQPERRERGIGRFAGGILARTSKLAQGLARSALRFLGAPYVFGGTSSSGFDCSGFVQHVFGMLGIALPRTADAQYDAGQAGGGRP